MMNELTKHKNTDASLDYSIIIPVYCNEGSLKRTYQILRENVVNDENNKNRSYEIVFIDDGSHDGSFNELMELKKEDPKHVKVIKFTRNFGQVSAIRAGLQYARGQCITNISADLQDPPELINQMMGHYFNDGYHVVIGSRQSRDESFFRRKTANLFYRIIKRISFPGMPPGGFDFFLVSSKVRDLIIKSNEKNPFLQGQILWPGFKIKCIPYQRKNRKIGKSKWTFSKKVKYLIDGMMAYSYLPLRMMSVLGIVISSLGFLYAAFIFFARILGGIPIEGWAPIMIVVLVLSGFQMLMLGIIGEYLWRTLDQVRNRDHFIVEEIYD
jgi:dolichol-phosphate mannosyltransferase